MLKQVPIKVTTIADGTGDKTEHQIVGLVYSVEVFASDLDVGADITITITDTGAAVDKTLLTLTDFNTVDEFFVRELESDNVGAALTTHAQPVAVGKPKVTVSAGGNTKTLKVIINYHDP